MRIEGAAGARERRPFRRLTVDTAAVNNSTALVDSGLSVPAKANKTYLFRCFLGYTATTTADLKASISVPAGAALLITPGALAASATGLSGQVQKQTNTTGSLTFGGTGAGTQAVALIEGTLITAATAGPVKIQFAQSTAEVSDALVVAGSWLLLEEIA